LEDEVTEEQRLRIKCNQYAKRLVLLGEDDVTWEATTKFQNTSSNSDYAKCSHVIGLICGTLGIEVSKCNELNLHDIYHKLIEMKQTTRELFQHFA
jgi:hypothetical protein